jgi:general secretion pathway protein D
VRLKIKQTLTKLDTTSETTTEERPTTFKREVTTTVIVHDNNTLVIGGLIDDAFSEAESKIPCLGDIPGLGWAFKSLGRGRDKTNLFIFLTPHVVKTREEAMEIYKKKKEQVDYIGKDDGIKLYYEKDRDTFEWYPTIPDIMETP